VILLEDPEALDPPQHDVVAPVRKPFDMREDAAAADGEHGRPAFVVALEPRAQEHHSNHSIAGNRVGDHVAIPGLENVQG